MLLLDIQKMDFVEALTVLTASQHAVGIVKSYVQKQTLPLRLLAFTLLVALLLFGSLAFASHLLFVVQLLESKSVASLQPSSPLFASVQYCMQWLALAHVRALEPRLHLHEGLTPFHDKTTCGTWRRADNTQFLEGLARSVRTSHALGAQQPRAPLAFCHGPPGLQPRGLHSH